MFVDKIKKEDCTGCKMCADICPSKAISFQEDKEGFWYPTIDEEKCSKCGLCSNRCPSLNFESKKDNHHPDVYSLWSNNDDVRLSSTSGGVFWEFASWFIEQGGVVAGVRFGKDWKSAQNIIATNIEELELLKGSKYFQSDSSGIYLRVKEYLEAGTKVLFCGTPCQNSALLSFLKKQYDNLYTMDFICRSINSPKAFRAYIDELERQYGSEVVEVHLKDKENGWQSLASRVVFSNGEISLKDKDSDYWVRGFIYSDLYTRESCYHCKFKAIPRTSADLSIGDFWGIKNQSEEDNFKGISVLLINSNKGKDLFECVSGRFSYEEHSLEEVLPGNPALVSCPVKKGKQEYFADLIDSGKKFSEAVSICLGSDGLVKKILRALYRKAKRIKELFIDKNISIPKYIHYNYFCKHIKREGKAKILPHKNAVLNFAKGSRILLKSGDLEVGFNQLRGSHSETHIRLDGNAVWECKNGALLFYDTVLEIKANAIFESGFFSANGGSVIIVHKNIKFGEDVMIGRNVIIYDSDFHSLYNKSYKAVNTPIPVVIEDHVWLTTNIMVQKGVTIGRDSLIAAYTVVNKDVPPHSIVGGKSNGEVIKDWVLWDRKQCPLE